MPLIIIAAGVALLLILMIGFKVNGFIALVLVAAVVGFAEGMDAQAVLHSIQNGIGSTLGGLAMILGFGAMLGKLISAQQAVDLQRGRWAVASRSLLLLRRFGFVLVCAVGVFPSEPPLCARNCGAVGRHGRLHLAGLCLQ